MKVINYEKTKGTFKIQYLEDNYIYEGSINLDENSISKDLDIFTKIIDYEEGEIFTVNGNEVKILDKEIDIVYDEVFEKKNSSSFNKITDKTDIIDEKFMNLSNARILTDDLIYFHIYYKSAERKIFGTYSNKILNGLKRYPDYQDEINVKNAYLELKDRIKNVLLYKFGFFNTNIVLVSVPSHEQSEKNNNSVAIMINEICKESSLIDGSQVLLRTKTIPQQKYSGKRYKSAHFNTIKVDSSKINDKIVLLIDDVTVSGYSIEYCKELLLKNGAKKVYCFSFSKSS